MHIDVLPTPFEDGSTLLLPMPLQGVVGLYSVQGLHTERMTVAGAHKSHNPISNAGVHNLHFIGTEISCWSWGRNLKNWHCYFNQAWRKTRFQVLKPCMGLIQIFHAGSQVQTLLLDILILLHAWIWVMKNERSSCGILISESGKLYVRWKRRMGPRWWDQGERPGCFQPGKHSQLYWWALCSLWMTSLRILHSFSKDLRVPTIDVFLRHLNNTAFQAAPS